MSPLFFLAALLSLCVPVSAARADDTVAYQNYLVDLAVKKRLHDERYWHLLLHYKRGVFGLRSLVDDPKFFLAPNGKRDPRAELEATIRAFFQTPIIEDEHPVCKFVARFTWLTEQLAIDEDRLPVKRCKKVDTMLANMKPKSTTLIFPTSHINSPASMYGHTLLIVETATRSKLLAYAINYSAVTGDENFGPLYALKGLFGFYPGYFSVLPYYSKIAEYSDFDFRDMWEYPLTLTEAETRRIMLHVFEMDYIASDYFFFDENCSFKLLFLLELARPTVRLTDDYPFWTIPLDTIRAVHRTGLVDSAIYRPSQVNKIRHIASLMSEDERELAEAVFAGKRPMDDIVKGPLPLEGRIRTVDFLSEYVQYKYSKDDITKAEYSSLFIKTLRARSELGRPELSEYSYVAPPEPTTGHESDRVNLGVGVRGAEFFQEIRYRPSYHALSDFDGGYVRGGQIVLGDVAVRYYDTRNIFVLQYLNAIDIQSISARDRFITPISWKVNTGLFQKVMSDGRDDLVFRLSGGAGAAWDIRVPGLIFFMADLEADAGYKLRYAYCAGVGASVGVLNEVRGTWKYQLGLRYVYFGVGDVHGEFSAFLNQQFRINANNAVSLELKHTITFGYTDSVAGLSYNLFF